MTTPTLDHRRSDLPDGYGFATAARMEWEKLRSVRSTWYLVAAFGAGMIAMAVLVLSHENYPQLSHADRAAFDPTRDAFLGLLLGQLLLGMLGVLAITTEFSSGTIGTTFAAIPRRPLVLAAKAAVLGAVTLLAGEIFAFAAFFAGRSVLAASTPHPSLSQPGVLRAVVLAGAYPALIALIGLGLGAIIRHTTGAVSALVGVLFLLPLLSMALSPSIQDTAQNFVPHVMASLSLTAVRPVPDAFSPALAFLLLCGYAIVALGVGAWMLDRRDA